MSNFLNKIYDARDAGETRRVYDDWATSYEAELADQGYATPARCAAALRKYARDTDAPILDFGCGTGLSGQALQKAGFQVIDGVDLSPGMLAVARDKGVYRSLDQIEAGAALPFDDGAYPLMSAVGAIGAGAAPAGAFHTLMRNLPKRGLLVFSLNGRTLQEHAYEGAMSEWTDCGAAQLLFRKDGPHLPGIDLNATVYVIEKS
ncbi:class I SAM-dependent DNA methyltransferase [Pseudosulfitobacter koreensis]|uniref:Methyltransferase domain-containing protein n=1 Tax=Pseudosulfitobacter koreensis TaxID=2968472 RepID=A0ABT1Z2E0_9RHOB|nr:methyltransferase domain-containing protein [Pseudosulfitobacter koreense]MCR8827275.1 methyltransferase domain-containing protein [Pseudosulfitobacter koreense]